jgi:hypothetical protein
MSLKADSASSSVGGKMKTPFCDVNAASSASPSSGSWISSKGV